MNGGRYLLRLNEIIVTIIQIAVVVVVRIARVLIIALSGTR